MDKKIVDYREKRPYGRVYVWLTSSRHKKTISSWIPIFLELFKTFRNIRGTGTHTMEGRQVRVYNRAESLTRFKQANLLDCRISAYPATIPEYAGINRQSPNFLFLGDLDLNKFENSKEELDQTWS
jgi:hypothetical protein